MGDDGGGRVAEAVLEEDLYAICGENFEGRGMGRFREGVGVHAQVKWPGGSLSLPVFNNGLADSGDMIVVKLAGGGGAAMPGGAKRHLLGGGCGVGMVGVVGRNQAWNVWEQFTRGRFSGKGM